MLNTTKMYIYRFTHSKSVKICLLLNILLVVLPIVASFIISKVATQKQEYNTESVQIQADFSAEESDTVSDESIVKGFVSYVSSGLPILIIAINILLLINLDEDNGYIKNIISYQKRNSSIILPRILSSTLYVLVSFIIIFIFYVIINKIFFPDIPFGPIGNAPMLFIFTLLLTISLISLLCSLEILGKNPSLPVVILIFIMTKLDMLFIYPINNLVATIANNPSINLSKYLLSTQFTTISETLNISKPFSMFGLILVYFVVSYGISALILNKRDIR